MSLSAKQELAIAPPLPVFQSSLSTVLLTNQHEEEVLDFLAGRPLHTVFLSGFIRDNGLESQLNRGSFYGCRNRNGQLEGVALVGHATLIEAHSEEVVAAFARLTQSCPSSRMIMGESDKVELFWQHFSKSGREPRRVSRELLLEQRWPVGKFEPIRGLRLATLDDLTIVMTAHAQAAFEENGVNPMEVDPIGYRMRFTRRIEQGRVWVWVEDGRLVFKTVIVSDTPHVTYLEGIYIDHEKRGQGFGTRCLLQLGQRLLGRTVAISLLVNEENEAAIHLYNKAGFQLRSYYDTIFLQ